jgi:hypothetical protein
MDRMIVPFKSGDRCTPQRSARESCAKSDGVKSTNPSPAAMIVRIDVFAWSDNLPDLDAEAARWVSWLVDENAL